MTVFQRFRSGTLTAVSSSIKISVGGGCYGCQPVSRVLGPKQLAQRKQEAEVHYQKQLKGVGETTLQILRDMSVKHWGGTEENNDYDPFLPSFSTSDQDGGDGSEEEEEDGNQAAGQMEEENEMAADLRNVFYNCWAGRHESKDTRSWWKHITQAEKNWAPLLASLTDAYLEWCYSSSTSSSDPPATSEEQDQFMIDVIDIYSMEREVTIPIREGEG
ncbi:hypothetical protein VNI00_017571 [Paramarasmius palmivorus]|uniref:Uncharacterized protein n=1 Tax=Paramarasmius palmivorus TaxID=297713 RepID=A0AAW0B5L9_9AGAR